MMVHQAVERVHQELMPFTTLPNELTLYRRLYLLPPIILDQSVLTTTARVYLKYASSGVVSTKPVNHRNRKQDHYDARTSTGETYGKCLATFFAVQILARISCFPVVTSALCNPAFYLAETRPLRHSWTLHMLQSFSIIAAVIPLLPRDTRQLAML
ncbi:hypothetical protein BS17DRAFT_584989 [Gyrodon lividus]|nr:hypothetical protein BS17DRAFT_584989 [Gyrodon lividus]